MTGWMHPPRLDKPRDRDRFDPIVEGARYGLPRELLLEIWQRARAEATDASGRRDDVRAQKRFHEIAARVAKRQGRRQEVGRATLTSSGGSGAAHDDVTDDLSSHAPGRTTLVEAEARRWEARAGHGIEAGGEAGAGHGVEASADAGVAAGAHGENGEGGVATFDASVELDRNRARADLARMRALGSDAQGARHVARLFGFESSKVFGRLASSASAADTLDDKSRVALTSLEARNGNVDGAGKTIHGAIGGTRGADGKVNGDRATIDGAGGDRKVEPADGRLEDGSKAEAGGRIEDERKAVAIGGKIEDERKGETTGAKPEDERQATATGKTEDERKAVAIGGKIEDERKGETTGAKAEDERQATATGKTEDERKAEATDGRGDEAHKDEDAEGRRAKEDATADADKRELRRLTHGFAAGIEAFDFRARVDGKDGTSAGKVDPRSGRLVDGHGLGLELELRPDEDHKGKRHLDPRLHLLDPKKAKELETHVELDPPAGQLVDPKLKGLELRTKRNAEHDHEKDVQQTAKPLGPAAGHAPAMGKPPTPKPKEVPKELLSSNQAALDGYIAKIEAERAKAKDTVAQQKLGKSMAAQIDAKAIAARVKAANDAKLAKLRADAAHDKAATAKAAEGQKHEGDVTVESLKAKLEDKLTADKQKFKEDFELKKQELTARLATQKETLATESKAQIDNLKTQQKARVEDANKRWEAQKAGFKKQAEDLMVQMRHQMEADKTKLADQQKKTMQVASDKAAAVEKDAENKAKDLIARGDTKAREANDRCVASGNQAYAAATAQASGEEDANKKAQILAGGLAKKRDFLTKGELSSKDIKAKAAAEAQKVRDTGAAQKKKVIETAANQVKAIDEKINSLAGLAQKRQAENEQALQAKLNAGQEALDKKIGELQKAIDKKQKEADDKIKKLEDDTVKKMQTEYDRELTAIDHKAEAARKALASGSQKNIAQLQKLVDSTLSSIDKSIADSEKRLDGTIAGAERQATSIAMTALKAIKAEADRLLVAIDREYDAQIKAVQDAVAATRKQIDDSAKGKMLEIEVHVATMLGDIGDKTRLEAVKKQLRWYVENKVAPPKGFGEVGMPAPAPGAEDKKDPKAAPAPKTPAQEAEDKKKAAEAEATRRADLDPEERAKEDADKAKAAQAAKDAKGKKPDDKLTGAEIDAQVAELIKKGQTATATGAQAAATASVKAAYDDGRHAINHVVGQKMAEIGNLERGGTDAQLEQHKVDQKAGQEAADKIAAAATREGFWGKDPNKKAILQALEGKTPAQIEALRAALLARTPPINIDDLLANTLSGDELKEARIRMTGDPTAGDIQALLGSAGWKPSGNAKTGAIVAGAVIAGPIGAAGAGLLVDGMSGSGVDKARIEEILKQYPDAAARAKFAEAFERQTGLNFNDFLKQNIPDDAARFKADKTPEAIEHEKAQAELLKKAQSDAAAGKIDPKKVGESVDKLRDALDNFHVDGTRADMVAQALEGKTPEEIALIMAEFKKRPGNTDLEAKLRTMLSGPALAQAEAMVHNDPAQIAVSKLMGAEQSSWTPWTVDDKKLQDTLEGLTDPEQRRRVLAMYKAQTGVDLQDVIAHKMTGNDKKLAECLAKGDTLGAAEAKLEEAAHGGWLNSMQDAAAQRFGIPKDVSKGITNVAIFGIGGAFLPKGQTATIDGYTVGDGGIHKVDADQIFKVMESVKDPADRAKLAELYKKATGKDLDADMRATLGAGDPLASGAKYDAFQALMEGDYDKAAACQAKAALSDGVLNDKEAFYKQLEGKSEWERKRIIAAFNKQYGGGDPNAFKSFAAAQLDGLDREKADLLATSKDDPATGVVKLPPTFELRYAMDSVWVRAAHAIDGGTKTADEFFAQHPALRIAAGVLTLGQSEALLGEAKAASWMMSNWGVDDQKVLQVLRENPELAKNLDPKLKAEIQYTLSGRSGYEAQYYLDHGVPQTPEEKIKFQLSMYDFGRGGSNAFSKGFTDLFSVSGKDYDAQYQQLLALQIQIDQCKKAGLPLPPELAAQASWMAGISSATGTQYEADKSKVATAAATAVGVVVGAVVTVFTGGVGGAILGALLAGMATIGTKAAILGNSYTRGEMGVDIVMTAVNALTAGVLKAEPFKAFCEGLKFLSSGGQAMLNAVLGGASAAALSSMVQTMLTSKDAHDLLGLLGQGVKAGLWAAVTGGANAAAMHALNGLLDSITTKMFGTNAVNELGKAYRKPGLVEAMLKGYISGGGGAMASMAVEAMADPAMLRGSWDAVLANAMQRFHEGGFQNAMQVGSEHLHDARVAAMKAAVAAAQEAQAAGKSPEEQRAAFADELAHAAQAEAAKSGKQLDGTPIAELANEVSPHGADEHATKGGAADEHATKGGAPDEHATKGGAADEHATKGGATDEHATKGGAADEHATKGGAPDEHGTAVGSRGSEHESTQVGAGDAPPASEKLSELANKSHIVERATAALEKMAPEQRAAYEQLVHGAENNAQKIMLERALAVGGTHEDLVKLSEYMKGYSEAEIVKRFTAADSVQFFQESCVPTSLQAARAQVDPLYAFQLMMDPVFAAQEQAKALQDTKGRRAERREGDFDRKYDALVDQHPDLKAFLEDPHNFGSGTYGGIEPSLMKGQALLENLQHATGVQYDIMLQDGMKWKVKGDGMFAPEAIPHDRIVAALERGLPVPFSADGHQQLLTDCYMKDGKMYYVVHDPMSGSTSAMPAEFMDKFPMMQPTSLMLPAEAPGAGGKTPAPDPAATPGAGSSGKAGPHEATPGEHEPTEVGGRSKSSATEVKNEFPALGLSDPDAARLADLHPELRKLTAENMAAGKPIDVALAEATQKQLATTYQKETLANHPTLEPQLQQIGDGFRNLGRDHLAKVIDHMDLLQRNGQLSGLEHWIAAAGAQAHDPTAFLALCGELGRALDHVEKLPPGHSLELVPNPGGSPAFTLKEVAGTPAPRSAAVENARAAFASDPEKLAAFDSWIAKSQLGGIDVDRMLAGMGKRAGGIEKAVDAEHRRLAEQRASAAQMRTLADLLEPQLAHTHPKDGITISYESKPPADAEIKHGKRIQDAHNEPVRLFGDDVRHDTYPGIDGTIGDPPRPLQLKTFGTNPEPFAARDAAMGALETAQRYGVHGLEVHMEFDALKMADIERGWNTPDVHAARPPGPVFDGDTVARIEIQCSDGRMVVRYDSATGAYTFERI